MTGLPPPHMPERGGGMPITPRKAKTGRIPPIEHRANAHRASPADARTGRAACQLRPERAKALSPGQSPWGETATHQTLALKGQKKHTLCAPAAPARRTPEKHAPYPRLRSRLGLQPASNTTPRTPSSHMPPARRAGRPTTLTPLQQERKKGHIPPHGAWAKSERGNQPSSGGAGQADPLIPPPLQQERKRGTSPAMEHGRNQKAETSPPDGAKKGWENMKSGH